jgi:hypothetical protein
MLQQFAGKSTGLINDDSKPKESISPKQVNNIDYSLVDRKDRMPKIPQDKNKRKAC